MIKCICESCGKESMRYPSLVTKRCRSCYLGTSRKASRLCKCGKPVTARKRNPGRDGKDEGYQYGKTCGNAECRYKAKPWSDRWVDEIAAHGEAWVRRIQYINAKPARQATDWERKFEAISKGFRDRVMPASNNRHPAKLTEWQESLDSAIKACNGRIYRSRMDIWTKKFTTTVRNWNRKQVV